MQSATVTKIGNSAGVAIPAKYRADGSFSVGQLVEVSNPRKGIIVLRSPNADNSNKLSKLAAAESRIHARCKNTPAWPEHASAQDIIESARKDRLHGSLSI